MLKYVRVSIGTAAVLGLVRMQLATAPTTAYLMLYNEKKCVGNCVFCPQARESKARGDALSRIFWPRYEMEEFEKVFTSASRSSKFGRICIQTINYPGFFDDLTGLIKRLQHVNIPISVAVHPLSASQMQELKNLKVNRIGIPLDAANEMLFNQIKGKDVKGPYIWKKHLEALSTAQTIFGKDNVSTHLIVGLGETEADSVIFLQKAIDAGILPALFSFTPIKGTKFENNPRPSINHYRKIQLARYLLIKKISCRDNFKFDEEGRITDWGIPFDQIKEILKEGVPFITSGCPSCNRPYYNERPGETLYNYPRSLTEEEISDIIELFEENTK
ncbi:MAG: radical SAM protein [Promethearchaeota archaeon]|nr:MAG: radical SAM protein [Candidatus Lokiarchaeota archaeon]